VCRAEGGREPCEKFEEDSDRQETVQVQGLTARTLLWPERSRGEWGWEDDGVGVVVGTPFPVASQVIFRTSPYV
jgi:hypothetical protein